MTKVDERSAIPPVDKAARERLAKALDVEGVVAAYVFGSQVSGKAGPLSDVDIAVWADPAFDQGTGMSWRLELERLASEALHTDEVDLVVLNGISPLLRHRVIASNEILVDRDPPRRVRFEAQAMLDYLDTKPLRAALARGVRTRIAEGRFGRS